MYSLVSAVCFTNENQFMTIREVHLLNPKYSGNKLRANSLELLAQCAPVYLFRSVLTYYKGT